MARPTKMTQQVVSRLEEAFALGCTDLEASLYANIAPSTLYKYQEANSEFSERKAQLKETPILKARASVIKAFDRSPELALKYLERKKKDEFSLRQEHDVHVQPVKPILGGQTMALKE